jgi:hypothetical protein
VNELVPDLTAETVAADLRAKELQQYQLRRIIEPTCWSSRSRRRASRRKQGVLLLRGRLLRPSHIAFPRWQAELARPTSHRRCVRPQKRRTGAPPEDVFVRIFPGVVKPGEPRVWINAVLFVLTRDQHALRRLALRRHGAGHRVAVGFLRPSNLLQGLPFAATLLGILAAHEFGHYFAARYHKVAVTLPYFIPMPLTFGTLGAFIQLKAPIPDRRKLFDIGVAGPLAGWPGRAAALHRADASSEVTVPPPIPGLIWRATASSTWAKWLVLGRDFAQPGNRARRLDESGAPLPPGSACW